MIYIVLFLEFFKVGLFTIGGGLASLPFLYELAEKYTWINNSMIADMIAISQSTPGPIGINMATYAGFKAGGILGGMVATFAIVLPSFIIIVIVANFLNKFKNSKLVDSAFKGLRPTVTGLIAVAWFEIIKISIINVSKFLQTNNLFDVVINFKALIIFLVIFFLTKKFDKHPIVFIGIGALAGIVFKFIILAMF